LSTIQGTLPTATDVDLYCIRILDTGPFFARILCTSFADHDLWLFDATGLGSTHDDGCQASWVELSNTFVSGTGLHYLAISPDGAVANSATGAIWLAPQQPTERAPDGPGAAQPVISWGGAPVSNALNYTIQLQGCGFCDAPTPARPGVWGAIKQLYR
jgi:hypothetical protein